MRGEEGGRDGWGVEPVRRRRWCDGGGGGAEVREVRGRDGGGGGTGVREEVGEGKSRE